MRGTPPRPPGDQGGCPPGTVCGGRPRGPRGLALGGQHHGGRDDAGQRVNDLLRLLAQGFELGAAFGGHLDGERHVPVLDLQARNHAQTDDVLIPVEDRLQGIENLFFGDPCHA